MAITEEAQADGHRYVMGNVNAHCPRCESLHYEKTGELITVLDCEFDGGDEDEDEDEPEKTYRIVRFFFNCPQRNQEEVLTGLTLEEAEMHCNDPETSSSTATDPEAIARTEECGPWFEGFQEE